MTNEQLLEKAKRDYPVGTEFIDMSREKVIATTDPWFFSENFIAVRPKFGGGACYKNGNWAEIISRPEESKNKETNHEKAIGLLEQYLSVFNDKDPMSKAMRYCLNQLKQYEVFDKPVRMEVKSSQPYEIAVIGRLKDLYVIKHNNFSVDECSPIKEKPLTRNQWYSKRMNGVDFSSSIIGWDKIENEYQEYLKNNEL